MAEVMHMYGMSVYVVDVRVYHQEVVYPRVYHRRWYIGGCTIRRMLYEKV
jgi:hypothetical protein